MGDMEGNTHRRRGTRAWPGSAPGGGDPGRQETRWASLRSVHKDTPAGQGGAGGAKSTEGWGAPGRGRLSGGGTSRARPENPAATSWLCDACAGHSKSQGDQALSALLPEGIPEHSGMAQPRCTAYPSGQRPGHGIDNLPPPPTAHPVSAGSSSRLVFEASEQTVADGSQWGRRLAGSGRRL